MQELLPIVAQPTRNRLIQRLWNGDAAAGELHASAGGVSFGAVSQHLRVLLDAGVVEVRREHRSRIYRLRRERLGALTAYFDSLWGNALDRLAAVAHIEAHGTAGEANHDER